jgi:succinate-acetate transporter protein
MAIFCGGLAQLLAGMWEFPKGNAFGATGQLQLFSYSLFTSVSVISNSRPAAEADAFFYNPF